MRTYMRQIILLPNIVKIFIATEIIISMAMGITGMELNFLLREKGFSMAEIGQILSLGMLASAGVSIFAGSIGDRYGYKFNMVSGAFLKVISTLGLIYGTGFEFLVAVRILNGISDCLMGVCFFPYITSFVGRSLKTMVYSLVFSAQALAIFFGNVVAGSLYTIMPSYSRIVLVSVALIAFVAVARVFFPKPVLEKPHPDRKRRSIIHIPHEKHVVVYYIYQILGYVAFMLSFSMVNLICKDFFSMTDQTIGYVIGSVTLFAGILLFVVPVIAAKWSRFRLNTIAMVLSALLYPAIGFLPGGFFVTLIVIVTVLQYLIASFIDGPMLETVPEHEKASFSGFKMFVAFIGLSAGNFLAGWLLDSYNDYAPIYYISGVLIVLQIVLYLFGIRKPLENGTVEVHVQDALDLAKTGAES